MDELLEPLRLSRDARKVLARLGRADAGPTVLYGQDERLCEQALRQVVDPVLQDAGLPLFRQDQYHWFVRELARLYRTRSGRELSFGIELILRKWQRYGLSASVTGLLVCMVDRQLRVIAGETVDTPEGGGEDERPAGSAPVPENGAVEPG
jgi:hypothetical protein